MYEQNENPWNDPQDSQSQQEMYHRNPEPGNASNGLAVAALNEHPKNHKRSAL